MSLSHEIKEKLNRFAKEQSQHYMDEAEMTYMEQLRRKTGQSKDKIIAKLAKFKSRSETALDAQNDMILYMSDYMNDLIAKGSTEQQAFERAKEELKFRSETAKSADLQERFAAYYENRDPAVNEAIGLFYAGFMFVGVSVGALVGFLGSGGREMFVSGGWIDTLIGATIGFVIGMGSGLISNAMIALKKRS
ncbi:MAG: hypothetical protein P0Y55_13285 [Candidatus Cohnella colombiensis]|uniref:Uncharacterized protein n=1 Tax=Candidatus Cohnella colombiensis TaxID=3121368 RepID=A0AA95EUN8_9BACL|nr:MAG: hypothetical protein P0Y55_13285 [Cohnella sp.]